MPTTKTGVRFCSAQCSSIGRGLVLYGPEARATCALQNCGKVFVPRPGQQCCSEKCSKRRWQLQAQAEGRTYNEPWNDRRRDRWHRRRAQKMQTRVGDAPVLRDAIGERDRWTCNQCGLPVNRTLEHPDPMSPSLDHVIPLSLGGEHTRENVRIAHLRCNLSKGNRGGGEQLLLIG